MYHMMISNNVWTNPWPGPWQWTADTTRKDNRSSLLDPAHQNYMRLKNMIEEAVRRRHLVFWLDLGKCSTVSSTRNASSVQFPFARAEYG